MKKVLVLFTAVALIAAAFPMPATASAEAHHRWQGVGIAAGVLALFGILAASSYNAEHYGGYQPSYEPPPPPPSYYYPAPGPVWVPGHWEYQRVWVPAYWVTIWIPGGYDGWGHWRPGRYERRGHEGRYEERRVWIDGHNRGEERRNSDGWREGRREH